MTLPPSSLQAAAGQGVRVVCRLRPMNDWEKRAGTVPAATASTERKEVAVVRMLGGGTRQVRSTFHFDDVLTSFSTQHEVFASTLEPLIGEVLAGFEATAFAYGQTGTGKTYTMEGNLDSDEGRGLVPRATAAVFNALAGVDYLDHTVTVSYLEIYNEELCDLLAAPHMQHKLDLKDVGSGKGTLCTGLSEVRVNSVGDILKLVSLAQERRRVAETRVNARSSRSHSIFTMKVRCRKAVVGGTGELENVGKLHLVDLAGSENAKKASQAFLDDTGLAPTVTGSTSYPRSATPAAREEEERERRNINQSLLTLGRVINALREGSGRVPYRDSKLTRLLQDALGGRCKTVIIATISPALGAVEETISTLTYAEQACGIKNRPVASSLFRTIRSAKGDEGCPGFNGGDFAELELKAAYLAQEVEEAQAALARQYREAQEYLERAAAAEARLAEAETELSKSRKELEEQSFARHRLTSYAETQHAEAKMLSCALDASSAHGQELHSRLESRCKQMVAIKKQTRDLCSEAEAGATVLMEAMKSRSKEVEAAVSETHDAHKLGTGVAGELAKQQQDILEELIAKIKAEVCNGFLATTATDTQAQALGPLVLEAIEALKAAEVQATQGFDAAALSLQAAGQSASTLEQRLSSTLADRQKAVRECTATFGRCLEETSQHLLTEASTASESLTTAATSLSKEVSSLKSGLRDACQQPLIRLTEGGLGDAISQSGDINSKLMKLLQREKEVEAPLTQKRWDGLLVELSSALNSHDLLSAANGTQSQLQQAIAQLKVNLESVSASTSSEMANSAEQLSQGQQKLKDGTQRGKLAIDSVCDDIDSWLKQACLAELQELNLVEDSLLKASETQKASLAADAIKQLGADSAHGLITSLSHSLRTLAGARNDIANQIAQLQRQRENEQSAVALLTKQRQSLQSDIDSLQSSLKSLVAELDAGKKQMADLKKAQSSGRERVLDAIIKAASTELSALRDGMELTSSQIDQHFESARTLTDKLADGTHQAAKKNEAVGVEVAHLVADWSQCVGMSCSELEASNVIAMETSEAIEKIGSETNVSLSRLITIADDWGSGCVQVSGLIGSAVGHSRQLKDLIEQLRPEWESKRSVCTAALETWVCDINTASNDFEDSLCSNASATDSLARLQASVSEQQHLATEHFSSWAFAAAEHSASMSTLLSSGKTWQEEEELSANARHASIQELESQVRLLWALSENNCNTAQESLKALNHLAMDADAPLLVLEQGAVSALKQGSDSIDAQVNKATSGLNELRLQLTHRFAESEHQALQELQASTTANLSELEALSSQAVLDASRSREAAVASTARGIAHWTAAEEIRVRSQTTINSATDLAHTASTSLAEVGGKQLKLELQKGNASRERSVAAVSGLTSGAAEELLKQKALFRSIICSAPLQAFEEQNEDEQFRGQLGLVQRPQEAERPSIALLPRPSDDELAAEYRSGGMAALAAPQRSVAQNIQLPAGATKRQVESEIWVDNHVDSENIGCTANTTPAMKALKTRRPSPSKREAPRAGSKGPSPRSVLGESNRPTIAFGH